MSFLLYRAQQRKLTGLCEIHCLVCFHICDLVRVDASYAETFVVDLEHDSESLGVGAREYVLQHKNDELHCRKIVIVQYHLKELWLLKFGLFLDQDVAVLIYVRGSWHRSLSVVSAAGFGDEFRLIAKLYRQASQSAIVPLIFRFVRK